MIKGKKRVIFNVCIALVVKWIYCEVTWSNPVCEGHAVTVDTRSHQSGFGSVQEDLGLQICLNSLLVKTSDSTSRSKSDSGARDAVL